MNLATFKERMEKAKNDRDWCLHSGPMLCLLIEDHFGLAGTGALEEIYCPTNPVAFWGRQIPGTRKELVADDAKAQRATILLLFEQQCLTYKLYEEF
jgi:hypothetical protein